MKEEIKELSTFVNDKCKAFFGEEFVGEKRLITKENVGNENMITSREDMIKDMNSAS